jgi:hypothetical protein
LEVPFLDYVFDERHKWFVCIGVPYATHYWQVADSSELNGTFKMYLTEAKEVHFLAKPPGHRGWTMTDIIPLVNYAYPLSFGNVQRGRKAIANRGWGPLTYILLQNPHILSTKTGSSEPESLEGNRDNDGISSAASSTLNRKKGLAGKLMDDFVRDEMKNEG